MEKNWHPSQGSICDGCGKKVYSVWLSEKYPGIVICSNCRSNPPDNLRKNIENLENEK